MHAKRLLVAFILLPLFYLLVMKLPEGAFFGLLLAAALIAQWEFYTMYGIGGLMKGTGLLSGAVMMTTAYNSRASLPYVSVFLFMAVFAIRLFGKRDPSSSLSDISFTILSLLYVPCLLSFQLLLRQNGPEWIIFLFGCVWAADSLAYYIGKSLGKRKLYREVSPNKTIAGAVGSLVGGSLSAWLLDIVLLQAMGTWKSVVIGAVVGGVAIIGDLVESMFKRDAGVKDSSTIIPGHGGILDKIDGVLFAGPVLYWVSAVAGLVK